MQAQEQKQYTKAIVKRNAPIGNIDVVVQQIVDEIFNENMKHGRQDDEYLTKD